MWPILQQLCSALKLSQGEASSATLSVDNPTAWRLLPVQNNCNELHTVSDRHHTSGQPHPGSPATWACSDRAREKDFQSREQTPGHPWSKAHSVPL